MTRRVVLLVLLVLALATTVRAQDDVRTEALLGLARVRRDAGDPAQATRHFEAARARREFTVAELAEYFWVLRTVEPARALALAHDILRRAPDTDSVREGAIGTALDQGDEQSAAAFAEEGRMLRAGTARWYRYLGEGRIRQRRFSEAADAFAAAARERDAVADDRLNLAVALTASGRNAEAVEAWTRVPREAVADRIDLRRLELQALALGGQPQAAVARLGEWLREHPDDTLVRSWLVDLHDRTGQPGLALDAIDPLLAGPDAAPWLRRALGFASRGALTRQVLPLYEALLATGSATRSEQLAFVGHALGTAREDAALTLLDALIDASAGCGDDLLEPADRIPGTPGTDRIVRAALRRTCADSGWGLRAVERTVAESRFIQALEVLARMQRRTPALDRQRGLLLHWTGASAPAIDLLTTAIQQVPGDLEVRVALVDALRTTGQLDRAADLLAVLLDSPDLPADRIRDFASVALDTERTDLALAFSAHRLASPAVAQEIRGRGLLLRGDAAGALDALGRLEPARMTPEAALARLDATQATAGRRAAWQFARTIEHTARAWVDVMVRRYVLERAEGDAADASRLLPAICAIDTWWCRVAEAEAAMALGQPGTALGTLRGVSGPAPFQQARVDELRASAHEALGEQALALALVRRLSAAAPRRIDLRARLDVLEWLTGPDPGGAVLSARTPGYGANTAAHVIVARALLGRGHAADAVRVLRSPVLPAPTLEMRILQAQALQRTGDRRGALEALADVRLPDSTALLLKASLQSDLGMTEDARHTLRTAADEHDDPALYLAWASLEQEPAARADVLARGRQRLPDHQPLATAYASALLRAGRPAEAIRESAHLVAFDESNHDAWIVLVEATFATTPTDAPDLCARLARLASRHPSVILAVADHVAGLVRTAGADTVRPFSAMLEALGSRPFTGSTQALAMTRARLDAALEDWDGALATLDAALSAAPNALPLLRLRADVLGWSGRHSAAIEAYDTYLAHAPSDIEADRQRARVEGWAGLHTRAIRDYDRLARAHPQDAAIVAEAGAKRAFFEGRWHDAVTAYTDWIAADPDSSEARFERAAAMLAAGQPAAWRESLRDLSLRAGHRLAAEALRQEFDARRPQVFFVGDSRSASGFEGARLLDVHREGVGYESTHGGRHSARLGASAERTRALAPGLSLAGYRLAATASINVGSTVTIDAQAGAWTIADQTSPDSRVSARLRLSDRLTTYGGVETVPWLENAETVRMGMTTAGAFAGLRRATPRGDAELRLGHTRLSDGNRRDSIEASATAVLTERFRTLRGLFWAQVTRTGQRSPAYFSPERFVRLDAGIEYTWMLRPQRFAGDRQKTIRFGFLQGLDDRGTLYHHPRLSADLPLTRQLSFTATADVVTSETYRESSFQFGLRYLPFTAER